jgi:hypothetical protein
VYNRRAEMPKRRVIIRELDLDKMSKRKKKQYKEIKFTPLTRNYFEKRLTYFTLKSKKYLADQYALVDYPNAMLSRLTSFKLHDRRYPSWLVKYNEIDQLSVRAGIHQPESVLGIAIFVEKDE